MLRINNIYLVSSPHSFEKHINIQVIISPVLLITFSPFLREDRACTALKRTRLVVVSHDNFEGCIHLLVTPHSFFFFHNMTCKPSK